MAEYVSSGIFGQITGPFSRGENAIASIIPDGASSVVVKFGVVVAEKDDMIFETWTQGSNPTLNHRFRMVINGDTENKTIWFGVTNMYESDDCVNLTSIEFPDGAPPSVLIDYTIYTEVN